MQIKEETEREEKERERGTHRSAVDVLQDGLRDGRVGEQQEEGAGMDVGVDADFRLLGLVVLLALGNGAGLAPRLAALARLDEAPQEAQQLADGDLVAEPHPVQQVADKEEDDEEDRQQDDQQRLAEKVDGRDAAGAHRLVVTARVGA